MIALNHEICSMCGDYTKTRFYSESQQRVITTDMKCKCSDRLIGLTHERCSVCEGRTKTKYYSRQSGRVITTELTCECQK